MTSPMEVRGMMVAGRRVSWATCEIVSSPTKAMIASDEPNANWLNDGRSKRNSLATISGCQTRTKPATTIRVWATIAMVPIRPLKSVEILMPRTFSQMRNKMPASDSISQIQVRWIGPIAIEKSVTWCPKLRNGTK